MLLRRARQAPRAVVALLLAACAHQAAPGALQPLVTDRPDFTESAQTVAAGHLQLEAGQTLAREGGTQSLALGELLLRTGLSRRVELRTALNSFAIEQSAGARATGFEDVSVGTKLALVEAPDAPSWRPAVGLIAAVSVPTGAPVFRAQRAHPSLKLLTAWDLTERIAVSSNLNWTRVDAGPSSGSEWSGSASVGVGLTSRTGLYAEAFGFGAQFGAFTERAYLNGGITFLVHRNLQLDVRAGHGAQLRSGDYFAGIGLSRRW